MDVLERAAAALLAAKASHRAAPHDPATAVAKRAAVTAVVAARRVARAHRTPAAGSPAPGSINATLEN